MSQQNEVGRKAFDISEDVVQYRAVKISTSAAQTVGYTGVGDRIDGIVHRDADDSDGDQVNINLRNRGGTHKVMVAGAVALTDFLYAAANGKLSATPVGQPQMIPLETAANDGDVIEAVFINGPIGQPQLRTMEEHAASDTLLASESGSGHTTITGAVTFTLPPAVPGLEFFFRVGVAATLTIDPSGAETVSLPSNGVAQATIAADAIGESVWIMCLKAGTWTVMGYTGTWT